MNNDNQSPVETTESIQQAQPSQIPAAPQPTKKKLSLTIKILIGISSAIALLVIGFIVMVVISYSLANKDDIDTEKTNFRAKPYQQSSFLDVRYAEGAREFKLNQDPNESSSELLGVSSDRKTMAIRTSNGLGGRNNTDTLKTYSIADGKLIWDKPIAGTCSEVMPDDTVLCSFWEGSTQKILRINILNGREVFNVPGPQISLSKINFLGKDGDQTLLHITEWKMIGTPMFQSILSMNPDGTAKWIKNIDNELSILNDCQIMAAAKMISCNGSNDDGFPYKTVSWNYSGEKVGQLTSNNMITTASDGWVTKTSPTSDKGVSISSSKSRTDISLFDPTGKQIKARDVYGDLIPSPSTELYGRAVSYPLEATVSVPLGNDYVVNEEGRVILKGNLAALSYDVHFKRTDNGKKIFTGKILGVSNDGKVVLASKDEYKQTEQFLINTETGDVIQTLNINSTRKPKIIDGIIVNDQSDSSNVIYLPGK